MAQQGKLQGELRAAVIRRLDQAPAAMCGMRCGAMRCMYRKPRKPHSPPPSSLIVSFGESVSPFATFGETHTRSDDYKQTRLDAAWCSQSRDRVIVRCFGIQSCFISQFGQRRQTHSYTPSDARAARALCGDDVRAERAPRVRGVHEGP